MSYCKYCGTELIKGEPHECPKKPKFIRFVSWLFDKSGVENPFRNRNQVYEREQQITPDNIALDDGEIPIKQYKVAILRSRMRCQNSEGRLQITNKRVLFRATGYSPAGKTTYQHAFSLDKIDGVEIHKDRRFRVPDFLFALLWNSLSVVLFNIWASFIEGGLGVGGFGCVLSAIIVAGVGLGAIAYFFWKPGKFFSKLLLTGIGLGGILALITVITSAMENNLSEIVAIPSLILWGIVFVVLYILYFVSMFLFVIKPNLMIEIKTSSGSPAIQIKHKQISFIWHKSEEFSGFDEILPWEDTDLAIKEVATIIDDIKTLGDFAIEKWQSN